MKYRGFASLVLVLLCVALAAMGSTAPLAAEEPPAATAGEDQAAAEPAESEEDYYELLRLFVDTLDQVERNYVQDLSRRELMEAAIEGMLSKLDQHSNYIAPDEVERFRADVEAQFGGIGIQVSKPSAQDELKIISPLVGTPAHRAGIIAGDVITHIEGVATEGMTLQDAIKRLKGKVGTSVEFTVRHPHDGESETVKVTREIVRVQTVLGDRRNEDASWNYMLDDEKKIAYIRVSGFARHTTNELREALENVTQRGMKGLVLDLRNNPGGLLSTAIQVSDMFIPRGRIVSTSGRNVQERQWDAHRRGTFEGFPMAVLVNEFSASASEIVAACLQDHKRAIVIGQRTFGKGSVQNIIQLEQGRSALKLTTAQYLRPNGKNIHRFEGAGDDDEWGVLPDDGFAVELTRADYVRLAEARARRDVIGPSEDLPEGLKEVADEALLKAVAYVSDPATAAPKSDDAPAAENNVAKSDDEKKPAPPAPDDKPQ